MQSIVREHFFDWHWDAAHLNSAAEFWLRLASIAAREFGYSPTNSYVIEVRLYGFLDRQVEALTRELKSRIATWDVPAPEVRQEGDDLILSSDEISGRLVPPDGLGLPFLSLPPFTGLVAEFRFHVTAERGRKRIPSTLVFYGELLDQAFLVKALWWSREPGNDVYHRSVPMPWESDLVEGINRFRETAKVKSNLVECFAPPASRAPRDALIDFEQRLTYRLKNVPFGHPRLRGLVARFILFSVLLTVFWGMGIWGVVQKVELLGLAWLPALLTTVGFVNFLSIEFGYLHTYQQNRRALTRAC